MDILLDADLIGQTSDSAAAMAADILTDAAAARALIAYLDAKFGNPACAVCCRPAAADGVYCYDCKAAMQRITVRALEVSTMPADFAGALEDVANGAHYCADDIDWYAVEREMWGD